MSTALRKIIAFLMQGDALALSVDALALPNLIRYELMKCCTK